jgi:transposase
MADPLLAGDGLWEVLERLLPERPAQRIGRPRVEDRVAFTAIIFVLVTGLPWRLVPHEIGCSGVRAWRRLRDWHASGVWARLHRELLRRLHATRRLDWSVGVVDGSHIRALRGGPLTGPSPVDRARTGSKHHLIVDRHGVPLAATLTGGNRNDVTQLLPRQSAPRAAEPRMRAHLLATAPAVSRGPSLALSRGTKHAHGSGSTVAEASRAPIANPRSLHLVHAPSARARRRPRICLNAGVRRVAGAIARFSSEGAVSQGSAGGSIFVGCGRLV